MTTQLDPATIVSAWESSSTFPTFDSDGGFVFVVFVAAMRLLLEELNCAIVRRLLVCVKERYLITVNDKIYFQTNEKHNHHPPSFQFLGHLASESITCIVSLGILI